MSFPFYIAKRYLFSRKSRNVINVISAISMVTVGMVTAALIILLSAFNGLEKMVIDSFDIFDPDLKIEAQTGKTFPLDSIHFHEIQQVKGVKTAARIIEENALFVHGDQQHIGYIKGIEENYFKLVPVDSILYDGKAVLGDEEMPYGILGVGVASQLGINMLNPYHKVTIFLPKRGKVNLATPFTEAVVLPAGLFQGQAEYSDRCIFIPFGKAEAITSNRGYVTSVELDLEKGASEKQVRKAIKNILGEDLLIRNRFEQHAVMFRVMKAEKLVIFLVVVLILIIASFNIIASLTMLIVEKKKDIMVMWSLGADFRRIKWVYVLEGTLVSMIGAMGGMFIGFTVAFIQKTTGFVRLGPEGEAPPYPIEFLWSDFLVTPITVIGIGFLASWLRIRGIKFGKLDNFALLK